MRELKFRAWDKKRKLMFQVMRINFDYQFPGSIGAVYPYPYDRFWRPEEGEGRDWYYSNLFGDGGRREVIEDLVLHKYTGKYSIDGLEVYEEDILRFPEDDRSIYKVAWNDEESGFTVYWYNHVAQDWYSFSKTSMIKLMQIVGNIYENPELLEAK